MQRTIWLLPVVLVTALWLLYPFVRPLVTKAASIGDLNSAQRTNIALAAQAIDGCVLRPGEIFSFNKVVGPRTERRGYLSARTYLDTDSPLTSGGGICCLSSLLYQVALDGALPIEQRVAHQRTVRTVPPGLDATVWYGGADLRFRNDTASPLMLSCRTDGSTVTARLMGGWLSTVPSGTAVHAEVVSRTKNELLVQVSRTLKGKELLVSRDLYRLGR